MPLLRNAPVVSPGKRLWLWWPSSLLQQPPGAGSGEFHPHSPCWQPPGPPPLTPSWTLGFFTLGRYHV